MIMKKETRNEKSIFKMSIFKRGLMFLICLIVSLLMLACINASGQTNEAKMIDTTVIENVIDSPIQENYMLPHDSIRLDMIYQVDRYIMTKTRGKHDPKLAEYLVDNSIKYDIDLCFMMSQTQIETCFGTAGVGRSSSRRSLFGVIKKRYTNYNEAIEDYCKLLKKSYLVKGRTEKDLMRRYVTGSGYRYAGSLTYERDLTKNYKTICKVTSLSNLQAEYDNAYNCYLASLNNKTLNTDTLPGDSSKTT